MLFTHLSFIWVLAILVGTFFIKNFIVDTVMNTTWAQQFVANRGWAALLNITSGLHIAITFAILFFFTSNFYAGVLAVASGMLEYGYGYWESKHRLPNLTTAKVLQGISYIRTLKSLSYTGILGYAIQFLVSTHLLK